MREGVKALFHIPIVMYQIFLNGDHIKCDRRRWEEVVHWRLQSKVPCRGEYLQLCVLCARMGVCMSSPALPLQEATPTHETEEKCAGPPGGGAEEAEQVNQFLEKEQKAFERASPDEAPPEVEVRYSS